MNSTWVGALPPHWRAAGQPRLVGRQTELGLLREAWTAVAEGGRQLVLIGADGGGGKSRLVIEAATGCADAGAAVLVGGCVADLGSPYQPFDGPVTALLSSADIEDGPRDLLALVAGHRATDDPARRGREYRPQLYGAVVEALRTASASRPLVLVLEDLHWAAPDGLQLLTYVVEHTADVPMLVLATHRTSAPDRPPALVHAVTGLYRLPGVQRLELPPLGVADIAEFLVNETGKPLASLRTAAQALHRHTGGNPFFLREVWRDLMVHGGWAALRNGTIGAPDSVRDTLQVRIDALTSSSRQLLELTAVLGDEIDLDLLMAMDAETAAPAGADAVLAAVDAAVDLRLLEPAAGAGADYRFPHALARQAVLDLMPPSRLARSHALAVEVLERHPEVDRWVQRLAHHCAGARALGYGARAVEYFVEAARLADQALAHEEAASLNEQAAALAERSDRRHELLLKAARSHFLNANFERAQELDDLVFQHGAPRHRLSAAIGFEAASWLGQLGHPAVERLSSALEGVDRDPTDPLYVRGISGLGRALAFSGAFSDAAALAERAIELARGLGQDALLADVLQAALFIGAAPGSSDVRLARAEELTALALRIGDLGHLGPAGYQRGSIGYLRGDRDLVDEAQAQMMRTARTTGQQFWGYHAEMFEYARHFVAGDLHAAELAARRQVERGRSIGAADRAEGPFGVEAYMVRREAGRLEPVRPLITGTERPEDLWAPGLLTLYTELGMKGPAERVLRWFVHGGLDRYEISDAWPATLAFVTEAALYLGDDVTAGLLRPRLAEFAGLNLAAGAFVALFGSADRYLGSVDSLLGRRCASEELESALAMDTQMQATLHVAHTLAAQAAHLRRVRAAVREVQEVAERARHLAEPLGLHRVLRMLEAVAPTGCSRPDGLTAREVDILRLLADGMSNREIARNLVISESTAANHVRSIFLKTGAANRTQAARYAAERNLLV